MAGLTESDVLATVLISLDAAGASCAARDSPEMTMVDPAMKLATVASAATRHRTAAIDAAAAQTGWATPSTSTRAVESLIVV